MIASGLHVAEASLSAGCVSCQRLLVSAHCDENRMSIADPTQPCGFDSGMCCSGCDEGPPECVAAQLELERA